MAKEIHRETATDLRKNGYSISYISDKIGVSRGTLSHWLRDIPYSPNESARETIKKARLHSAISKNRQKGDDIAELKQSAVKEMLGKATDRDIFMMGVGLFAGRGLSNTYERIELNTSDSKLAVLFMKWLERGLSIDKKNIFIRLSLHSSSDEKQSRIFWSKALGCEKENISTHRVKTKSPFGSVKIYLRRETGQKYGKKELGVDLFRKIEALVDAMVI